MGAMRGDSGASEGPNGCFSQLVPSRIQKKCFVDFLLTFEKIIFLDVPAQKQVLILIDFFFLFSSGFYGL